MLQRILGSFFLIFRSEGFLIRYAFLTPRENIGWLDTLSRFLSAAICQVELHLAPALVAHPHFGQLPSYYIYTDNLSEAQLNHVLQSLGHVVGLDDILSRVRSLNLDTDSATLAHAGWYEGMDLSASNSAALRRALADVIHLPPNEERLLLGLDISFLQQPHEFLRVASGLGRQQATYMVHGLGWGRVSEQPLYVMTAYPGPQCPGLLGDFFFLNAGVALDLDSFLQKLRWYRAQPVVANRTSPPCEFCKTNSAGLHAADQFAMMLTVAKSVLPPGPQGCLPLNQKRYAFIQNDDPPDSEALEAVHDKRIRIQSCLDLGRLRGMHYRF